MTAKDRLSIGLRRLYVAVIRGVRAMLRPLGLLGWLERRRGPRARWVRSLFAIYDFDDLVRLDLPWWSFAAVDEVAAFLRERPDARVFEWGSGASTVWLSRRAAEVVSVEHDPLWAASVTARLAECPNVHLRQVASAPTGSIGSAKRGFSGQYFDSYVAEIRQAEGFFDLIVIDGRAREACLVEAKAKLAPGGLILFDDTKRPRYRRAIEQSGLTSRHLAGLAVCLPLPDASDILSRA